MDEIEYIKLQGQYRPHLEGIAGNTISNTITLRENILRFHSTKLFTLIFIQCKKLN